MAEPNNANVASNPDSTTQPGAGGGTPNPNPAGGAPADKGVVGAGGGTPSEKVYTFKEDRSDWTPRHRLNEESKKRTDAERERDTLKAALEDRDKRIAALAGVTPQDPQEKEAEELRGIIARLFPKLGLLENLDEDTLDEVIEAARVARQSSNATWDKHTRETLSRLDAEATKVLGVDKLDEKVARRIQRAFRDEGNAALAVRDQQMRSGQRESLDTVSSDTDFIARFERGDASLVTEFVTEYLNGFIEPVRRSVTAQVTRFRPVPRGDRNRAPVVQGQKPEDLNTREGFGKALLAARGSGASNT